MTYKDIEYRVLDLKIPQHDKHLICVCWKRLYNATYTTKLIDYDIYKMTQARLALDCKREHTLPRSSISIWIKKSCSWILLPRFLRSEACVKDDFRELLIFCFGIVEPEGGGLPVNWLKKLQMILIKRKFLRYLSSFNVITPLRSVSIKLTNVRNIVIRIKVNRTLWMEGSAEVAADKS